MRQRDGLLTSAGVFVLGASLLLSACDGFFRPTEPGNGDGDGQDFPDIAVPAGFRIEKVAGGLTYPTAVTWDNQGRMYVLEAGGDFVDEPAPARIVRIQNGGVAEVANLEAMGIEASLVGLTWHDGHFYFTHRAADRTGAVSRMTMDGQLTQLFSGIIDSQSEHQVNDIRMGPDGKMYVASGPAGNAAVMGIDNAPSIAMSPNVHTTSCVDIVLNGYNFETPDFRTPEQGDLVRTGAFVPFGTETTPGQRIPGTNKCGGAILQFDPNNAEGTLRPYAHGFRNVIGMTWNQSGEMFAAVNGYDVRGSRPINDTLESTFRIRENGWYGFPDFTLGLEPVTDPRYDSPETIKAQRYLNGQLLGKPQVMVINHEASGLRIAEKSLIAGTHVINTSPSKIDAAPASWGDMAGQLFVAEWGDLAPATNPLRKVPVGYRVVRVNPNGGPAQPFIQNVRPGPASEQDKTGMGIERPFDVRFGPDGAMYIVDYGVAKVNMARIKEGKYPYEFPPRTGVVWKVTRTNTN